MTFESKTPATQELLAGIAGMSVEELAKGETCPTCHEPVGEFRNEVSEREYKISRMCQACQDAVFGV